MNPPGALFAGSDGLDIIRKIIAQSPAHLKRGGKLIFEIGYGQGEKVRALLNATEELRCLEIIPDLQRIPRVAMAEKK